MQRAHCFLHEQQRYALHLSDTILQLRNNNSNRPPAALLVKAHHSDGEKAVWWPSYAKYGPCGCFFGSVITMFFWSSRVKAEWQVQNSLLYSSAQLLPVCASTWLSLVADAYLMHTNRTH